MNKFAKSWRELKQQDNEWDVTETPGKASVRMESKFQSQSIFSRLRGRLKYFKKVD